MEPEPILDIATVVSGLASRGVRFLVIGRQAMILYGAPALTFDWDLWVHPDDRQAALSWLVGERGFESSRGVDDPVPIVSVFGGARKMDLFFYRAVRNIEGEDLTIEDALAASVEFADPDDPAFRVRVPCPEHLVLLKKLRPRNAKDEEDIRYLLALSGTDQDPRNRT